VIKKHFQSVFFGEHKDLYKKVKKKIDLLLTL